MGDRDKHHGVSSVDERDEHAEGDEQARLA